MEIQGLRQRRTFLLLTLAVLLGLLDRAIFAPSLLFALSALLLVLFPPAFLQRFGELLRPRQRLDLRTPGGGDLDVLVERSAVLAGHFDRHCQRLRAEAV